MASKSSSPATVRRASRVPRRPAGATRPRGRQSRRRCGAPHSGPDATARDRRRYLQLDPGFAATNLRRLDGVGPLDAARPAPHHLIDRARRPIATARRRGWRGSAASSAASSSSVGRRSTGSRGGVRLRRVPTGSNAEDQPRLEQRDVGVAPRDVAAQRGQQAGQQRRAQAGCSSEMGLASFNVLRRGSSAPRPSASRSAMPMKRIAQRLDISGVGECGRDPPAGTLRVGQPATDRGDRQHRGDAVEPDQRATSSTRSAGSRRSGARSARSPRGRGLGLLDRRNRRRATRRAPRRRYS